MHARGCGRLSPPARDPLPPPAATHASASPAAARRCWAALLLLTAAAATGTSAAAGWSHLAALERSGAAVSAAAVDLEQGTVLEQLNAGERLTPASLTKLATAAAVLDAWPPARAFQTRLVSRARIVGDTLEGDLILQGAGDPSLDDHSLWILATQLRGAGISRVQGRLIIDPAPFGHVDCSTVDRCRALRRSDTAYNAPVAAVGVDFGNWCVDVRPTRPGAPANVRGCGVAVLPIPVEGVIRTTRARARQTFWIERVTDAAGDHLRVGGDVPVGEPQQVYRSMSDPARGAGRLLVQTLNEIGIRIDGPIVVRPSPSPLPRGIPVLAQVSGLPLREQVERMLRYSNNYVADVLSLDLAAATTERRPLQLSDAGGLLADFLSRVESVARNDHAGRTRSEGRAAYAGRSGLSGLLDRAPGAPVLLSGSGLTTQNRISAGDLVALLEHEYHDSRRFPVFYGSLVVPGDAPFIFLRGGDAAWLDRVALKTGTLDDPVSVCGIAGYLRKRDGGWIAFAAIVNGTARRRHVPLYAAMAAEESDVEAMLARY